MQVIYCRITFILVLVTKVEVVQTATSFLEHCLFWVICKFKYNSLFYYSYNIWSWGYVFRIFRPYFIGGHINSNNKNTRVEVFLFAFLFLNLFVRLFLNLFRDFRIIRGVNRFRLLGFWLKYFDLRVFYDNTWGLYYERNNMSKVIALLDLMVNFPNIKNTLEAFFGFNFNRISNHLFLDV